MGKQKVAKIRFRLSKDEKNIEGGVKALVVQPLFSGSFFAGSRSDKKNP